MKSHQCTQKYLPPTPTKCVVVTPIAIHAFLKFNKQMNNDVNMTVKTANIFIEYIYDQQSIN